MILSSRVKNAAEFYVTFYDDDDDDHDNDVDVDDNDNVDDDDDHDDNSLYCKTISENDYGWYP